MCIPKRSPAFGDFTYDFTDQFSVSVGGRYTWDERQAQILRQNYLGGGSPVFGGAGVPFGAPGTNFRGKSVFKKFTPRASVSFKPTPDHNLYASYSQGFKGGGFDPRGVGANAPRTPMAAAPTDAEVSAFLSFAPESVNSYEIGYKGALLDRRLTVALAAFRADYKDVQIPGSVGCTVAGLPSFCGVVSNAGKARFQGFEAEAHRRGSAAGSACRARSATSTPSIRSTSRSSAARPTDVAAVPQGPEHAQVDVERDRRLHHAGRAAGRSTRRRPGRTAARPISSKSRTPIIDQKGYSLLDANLVYRAEGGRWSFGLHAKNILDKQYKTSGYVFLTGNATTGVLNQHRGGQLHPVARPRRDADHLLRQSAPGVRDLHRQVLSG